VSSFAHLITTTADIFPAGGSPVADVFAIVLALILFALLYWAIDLIDRI
jgi:hypothetical protein